MFFLLKSVSIILFAFGLSFCLFPILIVGILNDGASIMPQDELPTITDVLLSNFKNLLLSKFFKTLIFSLLLYFLIKLTILEYPKSLLG